MSTARPGPSPAVSPAVRRAPKGSVPRKAAAQIVDRGQEEAGERRLSFVRPSGECEQRERADDGAEAHEREQEPERARAGVQLEADDGRQHVRHRRRREDADDHHTRRGGALFVAGRDQRRVCAGEIVVGSSPQARTHSSRSTFISARVSSSHSVSMGRARRYDAHRD